MRMTLGLDRPTAGSVTVNGKPFAAVYSAMREVGALLDAKAVHGGRSAYHHLLCLAQTNAIPRSRVDEVIGVVGLEDVAGKRSKGFSLGMSQRLGIAAALLGAPEVLMFDEPVNGLDPEGIRWIRLLMRSLAAEGRTAFVSALITSFTSFFIGQAILSGKHYNTTLTQPGVLRRAALGGDRHGVRAARLRHRRAHPAHRRGDHRDPRGDLPDPGAGRGPAEQLVRGRDPVAARRRGAQPHCQVRAAALPAPVQRLG
jgi:ABC-type transport system involved in cytochrome c biogenesis ATPase subunit